MIVLDKSRRTPGLYAFRVVGKKADFQVDPAGGPWTLTAVLGNGYQTSNDQCAAIAFNAAAGDRPRCTAAGRNDDRINCR